MMLTITRKNQRWTAQFSNGHLFNHQTSAPSPITALQALAVEFRREAGPTVELMAQTVEAIAANVMAGDALPVGPVNLAEYYYRNVA